MNFFDPATKLRCSFSILSILFNFAFFISWSSAQVATAQPRLGVPQDWTHQHIVFNRLLLSQHPELAALEPRRLHQAVRRGEFSSFSTVPAAQKTPVDAAGGRRLGLARDWNVSLGVGAVAFGMSPAKYGFDENAPPSCTDDYAVFGLQVAGVTAGQANLIAFNNLYSGAGGLCGSSGPSVIFAYNITTASGGAIATSPVLSLDGAKIAFIESTATASIFHVLTWSSTTGNGTSATNAAVPGVGNTASMISITYAAITNTRSSPWVDYVNDVAYMGADDGKLYKITGVFNGTPALAGSPWPVTIAANLRLSAPVLDQFTRNIFVGDGQGGLKSVNVDNPGAIKSLAVGLAGSLNPVISDGPIVDADNGTVFAISANDGTSAVVVQADTTTLVKLARARIGLGSVSGVNVDMYDGAFDNDYYTDPSSGFFLVCGTGANDTTPWRYQFGFNGRTMKTLPGSSGQMLSAAATRCSPVTEYFNSNIGGGTDFFYWGLTANCTGASTPGCVRIRTPGGVTANVSEAGGTSAIIIDNKSTAGQASSIYFTDQIAPKAAFKLAQTGQ